MEVEFSRDKRESHDDLPGTDVPTSTSPDEQNGAHDTHGESFSQSQTAPLLSEGQREASSEDAPTTLDEMESKYAAYVRNDTYGTMGKGDISIREKALLVLALLIIVPIKIAILLTIVIAYYIICRICTLFRSPDQDEGEESYAEASVSPLRQEGEENNSHVTEPGLGDQIQETYAHMTGLRRSIIVHSGRLLSRAVLFVLGFYWIKVTYRQGGEGTEILKEEEIVEDRPGAIISNHVSYIDILYHMSASFPSYVAKRSVAKLPLVGLISKCLGCVYVQREDKRSDFKGVSGIVSGRLRAAHRDKDAPLMMLFPEGTTTNGDYLLPFKTGAFLSGTPVQPVLLKYTYRRFSPAWDTISGVRHVVLLLCQFINHLEVVWLPVYVPSEKEKADPKLYASNVRKLMADEGCLTLSDIGLPEKRIYHAFLNELLASKSLY